LQSVYEVKLTNVSSNICNWCERNLV